MMKKNNLSTIYKILYFNILSYVWGYIIIHD
jgi:hypothetical protein